MEDDVIKYQSCPMSDPIFSDIDFKKSNEFCLDYP